MIVTFQQVTDYVKAFSYEKALDDILLEIDDLYDGSFGQKLRQYFFDNNGSFYFEDIEVICSNDDPNLEPLGWNSDEIHSIAKGATDPDTLDIIIIHNTDVFEIIDSEEYKNLLIYFLYHELTHRLRAENGCKDKHFDGDVTKDYLFSEGELNAFMVQYCTKLFNGAVLDKVYSSIDLDEKDYKIIKEFYKKVKA